MHKQETKAPEKEIKKEEAKEESKEQSTKPAKVKKVKEPKVHQYNPSEKEVDVNGRTFLEWTDANGCTFREPKL